MNRSDTQFRLLEMKEISLFTVLLLFFWTTSLLYPKLNLIVWTHWKLMGSVIVSALTVYIRWFLKRCFSLSSNPLSRSIMKHYPFISDMKAQESASKAVYGAASRETTDDHIKSGARSNQIADDYGEFGVLSTETTDGQEAYGATSTNIADELTNSSATSTKTKDDQVVSDTASGKTAISNLTFCAEITDHHDELNIASKKTTDEYIASCAIPAETVADSFEPDVTSPETTINHVEMGTAFIQTTNDQIASSVATRQNTAIVKHGTTFAESLNNCDVMNVVSLSDDETTASELEISTRAQSVMERLMDSVCENVGVSYGGPIKGQKRIKPTRKYVNSNIAGKNISFQTQISSGATSKETYGHTEFDVTSTGATNNHVEFEAASAQTSDEHVKSDATPGQTDFVKGDAASKRTLMDCDMMDVTSMPTLEKTISELDISVSVQSLMERLMNSVCEKVEASRGGPIKIHKRIKPTRKCEDSNLEVHCIPFDRRVTEIHNYNFAIPTTRLHLVQNVSEGNKEKLLVHSTDSCNKDFDDLEFSLNDSISSILDGSINRIPLEFIYPCLSF